MPDIIDVLMIVFYLWIGFFRYALGYIERTYRYQATIIYHDGDWRGRGPQLDWVDWLFVLGLTVLWPIVMFIHFITLDEEEQ